MGTSVATIYMAQGSKPCFPCSYGLNKPKPMKKYIGRNFCEESSRVDQQGPQTGVLEEKDPSGAGIPQKLACERRICVKVWWNLKYCSTWLPGAIHMQNNARTRCQCEEFVVCLLAGARQRFNSRQNEGMPCALPNPHGKFSNLPATPDARSNQIFVAIFSAKLKIKILKRLPCVTAGHTAKPVR
jgi:hypothetical protein